MENTVYNIFRWMFLWVRRILQYERIDVLEGINTNKISASKVCFVIIGYKSGSKVCNKCHNVLMTAYELKNIAILNVKGVDYKCILLGASKSNAINILKNSVLEDKGAL